MTHFVGFAGEEPARVRLIDASGSPEEVTQAACHRHFRFARMTEYLGHDDNMRAFSGALSSGKLHHGWILAGPRGLGKAAFARNAAMLLVAPDGQHRDMIARGHHPDVITIERPPKELPKEGEELAPDAERKRSIGVDQIRSLQSRLTTRPGMADKRAIIIDAADDMERSAANALLKSLEEPPAGTSFLPCQPFE